MLDTYLHASLDDSRLSTRALNDILDALSDPGQARSLLDPLTEDQVSDLLDRMADHPDRLPTDSAVDAALEVLRLRPRLGERIGFGMPHEWKVMSAVNALLTAIDRDRRLAQVDELIAKTETISDACMILRAFGTSPETVKDRRDPDLVHFTPDRTVEIEKDVRRRVRDDPSRLADEVDFGLFFSWIVELDDDTLKAVRDAAATDERLFLKLLDSCVHHTHSSAPPFDNYELNVDDLERRLGPVAQAAERARAIAPQDPPRRLAAGLQNLHELAETP